MLVWRPGVCVIAVSSTCDVLEMIVVRSVGGVCVFGSGRCGWRGG